MGMSVSGGNRHNRRGPSHRVIELIPAISPPPCKVWWESWVEDWARDRTKALFVSAAAAALCGVASYMQDAKHYHIGVADRPCVSWARCVSHVQECLASLACWRVTSACTISAGVEALQRYFRKLLPAPPKSLWQRGQTLNPSLAISPAPPRPRISANPLTVRSRESLLPGVRPSPFILLDRGRIVDLLSCRASHYRRVLPPGVGRIRARSAAVAWWMNSTCRC